MPIAHPPGISIPKVPPDEINTSIGPYEASQMLLRQPLRHQFCWDSRVSSGCANICPDRVVLERRFRHIPTTSPRGSSRAARCGSGYANNHEAELLAYPTGNPPGARALVVQGVAAHACSKPGGRMHSRLAVVPVVPPAPFLRSKFLLRAADGLTVSAARSRVVGITPQSVTVPTLPRHTPTALQMVCARPRAHDGRRTGARVGRSCLAVSFPSKGAQTR